MTPLSWENWIARYDKLGYRVLAPSWPGLEVGEESLRKDPSPLANLGLAKIIDHYDRTVRGLDRPPVIMGHSYGGAIVQVLLSRGLGAVGVAIDPAPVRGVLRLPLSTLKASAPVLGSPFNLRKAVRLTPDQFHYAFTNTLTAEESRAVYDRYHVPAAARVLFDGALANVNPKTLLRVDFRKPDRAPLLIIAGERDHIVPAKINRENFKRYAKSGAVTEFREFPGRTHFIVGQEGWAEVADLALEGATQR